MNGAVDPTLGCTPGREIRSDRKLVAERACRGHTDLLFCGQASATLCRRALFCCRVGRAGPARANPQRVTAMACDRSSALSENKPKSDPADARRLPAGVLPRWAGQSSRLLSGQHRQSGTAPASGPSPYPRPVEALPLRSERPGSRPALPESSPADPHVDNRRFVTRHLVGQQHHQMPGWLTMASSHTARCAAAGRRFGTFTPDSRRTTPDS